MNFLCTLSGAEYDAPTSLIVERGPKLGNCRVLVYDDEWFMDHPFWDVKGNQWLAGHSVKRGLFWYVWKPLVILDAFERFAMNGDVVMWDDADSVPVQPFDHLFDQCRAQGGVMLFRASGWKAYQWTKRDMRICMGTDGPYYHDREHDAGVARFCLFQKGSYMAQQFLWEWQTYLVNPFCNTFDASVLGEEKDGFREHRCDQAIMQDLSLKYGIPLHPELDYELGIFSQENPRPPESRQTTAPIQGSRWRNV